MCSGSRCWLDRSTAFQTTFSCDVQEPASTQSQAPEVAQPNYASELQQRFALPSSQQAMFRQIMFAVYDSACQQLERDHASLLAVGRENSRILNNRSVSS